MYYSCARMTERFTATQQAQTTTKKKMFMRS